MVVYLGMLVVEGHVGKQKERERKKLFSCCVGEISKAWDESFPFNDGILSIVMLEFNLTRNNDLSVPFKHGNRKLNRNFFSLAYHFD